MPSGRPLTSRPAGPRRPLPTPPPPSPPCYTPLARYAAGPRLTPSLSRGRALTRPSLGLRAGPGRDSRHTAGRRAHASSPHRPHHLTAPGSDPTDPGGNRSCSGLTPLRVPFPAPPSRARSSPRDADLPPLRRQEPKRRRGGGRGRGGGSVSSRGPFSAGPPFSLPRRPQGGGARRSAGRDRGGRRHGGSLGRPGGTAATGRGRGAGRGAAVKRQERAPAARTEGAAAEPRPAARAPAAWRG